MQHPEINLVNLIDLIIPDIKAKYGDKLEIDVVPPMDYQTKKSIVLSFKNKNFRSDLFIWEDGHLEYSAISDVDFDMDLYTESLVLKDNKSICLEIYRIINHSFGIFS